jgi:hypothetical protein
MTLSQLDSLTDEELGICLVVVNVLLPVKPPMEINERGLTWFKHDALMKKLLDAFPRLKPEGHATYISLMEKLGMKVEIKPVAPPPPSEATAGSQ